MNDEWLPLGVDTEDEIAKYNAPHDGVPEWMEAAFWAWIRSAITSQQTYANGLSYIPMLNVTLAEEMCQTLYIALPDLRAPYADYQIGEEQINSAMEILQASDHALQIADYLLAHVKRLNGAELNALLERSKSAWKVGIRCGRPGLERRVPEGVQKAADAVMAHSGKAGIHLAQAWEALYGLTANASEAYRLAVLAVEDAAIPVVSPNNSKATLGTVISQIQSQNDWRLPMIREPSGMTIREVLIGMMKTLWAGQHDRHGGQPTAPDNVNFDEASVAIHLAATLVAWFDAGLVRRQQQDETKK